MVKKLLFILIVTLSFNAFAQQKAKSSVDKKSDLLIKNVVASPNPFSVTTKIKFYTDTALKIDFLIKDLIGNTVYTKRMVAKKGTNSIPFYRGKLDSGIYIYSIKTSNEIISKRIVIK